MTPTNASTNASRPSEAARYPRARWVASSNADARESDDISLIVLHSISLPRGHFAGDAIEALFTNRLDTASHPSFHAIAHLKVSAHFLIRRDGGCVQFVNTERRAWHAGQSQWFDPRAGKVRSALNDFSIGIELEGCEGMAFRAPQYLALSHLIEWLMVRHPGIAPARITSHQRVAPLRKGDPGPGFDWAYLQRLLDQPLEQA